MDETVQYLRNEYEDVNRQWIENEARRDAELQKQTDYLNQQDKRDTDPMLAAGIGGIYGRDPFQEYQRARLPGIAREGTRRSLINENLASKEKSLADLREKVIARMNAAKAAQETKNRWVASKARDGIWLNNEATGEGKWAVGPVDVFKLQEDYKKRLLDHANTVGLYKRPGWTDDDIDNQAKILAKSYANGTEEQQAAIEQQMRNMGIRPLDNTALTTPQPKDTSSTAALQLQEIEEQLKKYGNNPRYAAPVAQLNEEKQRLTAMLEGNVLPPAYAGTPRQEASMAKMAAGTGVPDVRSNIPGSIPPVANARATAPTSSQGVGFAPTTQQRAKDAEKIAELDASGQALRGSNAALMDMERLSLAADPKTGKLITSQGPASELITNLGGWVNYFDPKGTLAKTASNNAAFFSAMQNQVRTFISAYGSGTAVSNLDLIVAQMSAGSLDNTLNGRLKIIGASRAMNEAMAIIQEKQRQHLANGGTMADFKLDPKDPIIGLAPVKKVIDGNTYVRYEPLTKETFLAKFTAKYPKASVEDQQKEWYNFAMQKGAYSPDKRK